MVVSNIFLFSPLLGEDEPILTSIFFTKFLNGFTVVTYQPLPGDSTIRDLFGMVMGDLLRGFWFCRDLQLGGF